MLSGAGISLPPSQHPRRSRRKAATHKLQAQSVYDQHPMGPGECATPGHTKIQVYTFWNKLLYLITPIYPTPSSLCQSPCKIHTKALCGDCKVKLEGDLPLESGLEF
jgi:hypothetical protein